MRRHSVLIGPNYQMHFKICIWSHVQCIFALNMTYFYTFYIVGEQPKNDFNIFQTNSTEL